MRIRRTHKRTLIAKLLLIPIVLLALISKDIYIEEGIFDLAFEDIGLFLLIISALGRIWSSAYISGKKNRELIVSGPYSITRNPLYFFSLWGYLGAGLVLESALISALLGVVFFLTHWPTILREEKKLEGKFGEDFRAYMRDVPRFFPNLKLFSSVEHTYLSTVVFSKAIVECMMILSVFLFAHSLEWAHINSYLPVWFHVP